MKAEERARQYLALARMFDFPKPETWQPLERIGAVPSRPQDEREADYLATFEPDSGRAAISLHEGVFRQGVGREGILEDLMRFYEFFDARLSETDRDYPDHLATELEFMALLCQREAGAEASGGDARPFRLASRDFLARHLLCWIPGLAERLAASGTIYGEVTQMLVDCCRQHANELETIEEGVLP